MTYCLDVVAVRIQDECSIVVGVIDGTQARTPIITTPCGQGGMKESVHLISCVSDKRNMEKRTAAACWCGWNCLRIGGGRDPLFYPEGRDVFRAKARPGGILHRQGITKWRQCLLIEELAPGVVGNAKADMVEHE